MSGGLAIPGEYLLSYLQNIVDGRSMRDISRAENCQPSTILRRIRRCEELRDHPEWEAVLTALENHRMETGERSDALPSRATVLAALSLSGEDLASQFASKLHFLRHPKGQLLTGDMPAAAVTVAKEVKGSMPRAVVLAALAIGWIEPVGPITGRARLFRTTKAAQDCINYAPLEPPGETEGQRPRAYGYSSKPLALEQLLTRKQSLITHDHLMTAREFQAIYMGRAGATADAYQIISQRLPPRLMAVLDEVCGKGTGFETLEQAMKLPARSGKALVAAALETLTHTRTTS